METPSGFKSGLAVLVGRTNVGKSTLLNALVGSKIAIVTPRPQTTRHTYHGVVNRPGAQIVFVDTPGVFRTAPSKLVQNLHKRIHSALEGADALVHVVDPSRPPGDEDSDAAHIVEKAPCPKVLCLNKLDLAERRSRDFWMRRAERYQATVDVSALKGTNIERLADTVAALLPQGEPMYSPEQITNVDRSFWYAEVIREKVFLLTGEEIPYSAAVQVEAVEDRKDKLGHPMLCVKAAILAADERRQRMLIGQGGRKIKEIGTAARKDLEAISGRKVFLDLAVLVDAKWVDKLGRDEL